MTACSISSFNSILNNTFTAFSDRIALKTGNENYTYRQIQTIVQYNAARIMQLSSAHMVILFFSEKRISLASYIGVLSVLSAGRCAVMLPEYLSEDKAIRTAQDYGADLIISDHHIASPDIHCLIPEIPADSVSVQLSVLPELNEDDDCFVLFTSGTTEEPKGVLLSHGNVVSAAKGGSALSPYAENDMYVSCIPYYHGYSLICDLICVIMHGGCLCAATENGILRDIQFYRPDYLNAVPELVKVLLRVMRKSGKEYLDERLDNMRCGGAGMDDSVYSEMAAYGINIYNCYGLTELTAAVSASGPSCYRTGSAGRVIPGDEVRISNEGQIMVKGKTLFKGYIDGKQISEPDEWFETGDLGTLDEDGYLYILGRADNGIILENGEKIIPEQMELQLQTFPCIKEALVYKDVVYTGLSAQIVAEGDPAEIADAVDRVNRNFPSGAQITHYIVSDEPLKRNQLGKLIRRKI